MVIAALAVATPGGLEPPTNSLEGCCSIQLSYGAGASSIRALGELEQAFLLGLDGVLKACAARLACFSLI